MAPPELGKRSSPDLKHLQRGQVGGRRRRNHWGSTARALQTTLSRIMPMKSSTVRSDNWRPDERKPASAQGLAVSTAVADDGGGPAIRPARCPARQLRNGCER